MRNLVLFVCLSITSSLFAQGQPPATPAEQRIAAFEQRQDLAEQSIVNGIEFRNVGPTVFSGRVVDLAVSEEDPSHFYVAYASAGLWKTVNNGITFEPLFDDEMVMTTGAVAVDWENNTIWLGTGEVNSSRSSYAGIGVYKSTDDGESWEYMGLPESHHIGRILIHPDDPNTVFVAALGHLYSPNEERGVYKTTNGGKTWEKVLYVNENAGAVDMVFDPQDPNTLYAATWERTRRAWDFLESGEGSAIYKSTNNGKSWKRISTKKAGFPADSGAGRIGLTAVVKDGKTLLYSAIDNYNRRPKEEGEASDDLTKDDLRDMSKEDFLDLEEDKLTQYLRDNRFPRKYDTKTVIGMVEKDEIKPKALVEYIEDANSLLFDTPVVGLEVYVSDNDGKSWTKTHDDYIDAVYSSYGYYFGNIRAASYDPDKLFILGVPVIRSDDGGATWKSVGGPNVHSDHHALWINPNRPGHLILGNDGGVNISYDDGENWNKCNSPALGQFYYIAVDMQEPYNIYGGLQDNGVWFGPSTYEASTRWQSSGQYPYRSINGGDGMQVMVDTRDNETVYTGSQFGYYSRINTRTGERNSITPRNELGDRPLRWNWQTPIHLSVHNQDILYMGSNKVHRSFDQGENFEEISGDLTKGGLKGDVPYGTLTTIHESPLQFGLLYVGSDDGLIHVSKDGGVSWENISSGLEENNNMWVSRVIASSFEKGRLYAVLNGYRWDDFNAYVYVSEDYGRNWRRIGTDLPLEPANVIKEDPDNPDILYVGTDHGLYVSLDRGENFMLMNNGLPAVPVHDVVVHPREKDIVVGTHGRSIYIGRGTELQQLDDELLAMTIHAFEMEGGRASGFWGRQRASWSEAYEPSTTVPAFAKNAGEATLSIQMGDLVLKSMEVELIEGLNYLDYDYSFDASAKEEYQDMLNEQRRKGTPEIELEEADNGKMYLNSGTYKVVISKDGETATTEFTLR
ncbi:MAG TPA: hypothetical protein VJ953_20045 [Saprospiraceae bacterium]|nr:hypothetical protein [Saprospiraceae bacterium]